MSQILGDKEQKEKEALVKKVMAFRRHLHRHPELSFSEYKTSEYVAEILEDAGIEVERHVAGTGVVGLIKGHAPGKTIALRADMDALPIEEQTGLDFASANSGVMHACGHDFHMAILLGAALFLNENKEKIHGAVKLIFQPGEEKLTGAKKMIEAGVLENPAVDAIIALHCWPELPAGMIGVRKGPITAAADFIEIDIKGKAGHAAHPEQCVDPIVIAGHIVSILQTVISREVAPTDPAVLTIGQISGGTAPNVIPSEVKLTGMIRTVNPELQKKMPGMIKRIVTKAAESMNGAADVSYTSATPPLISDDNMVALIDDVVTNILGKDRLVYLENPSLGSEDFSFYAENKPGVLFRLGTHNETEASKFPLHNSRVIFEEKALMTGVSVISEAAVRYLI
ncbi:amidohydrolase/hippurate hydrolase [Scopulibacillus darangshiensis]|uniref:Amidohydrolase/hippurate hydrolase n=1 Tax=Scopulibacillus darangshiensis TaxID=442528 RepID=A0A4R2P8I0_9BACL|nr:M20 family metallopeptidase [Scopulibacillus darangshiensis]TCP31242.1 amidohydrolase/hippurate hydrolase [Scopulibacillus darangshiensis]